MRTYKRIRRFVLLPRPALAASVSKRAAQQFSPPDAKIWPPTIGRGAQARKSRASRRVYRCAELFRETSPASARWKRSNRKTRVFTEPVNDSYKSVNKRRGVVSPGNRASRVTVRRKRCPVNSIKIIRFVDTLRRRSRCFRSGGDISQDFTSVLLSRGNPCHAIPFPAAISSFSRERLELFIKRSTRRSECCNAAARNRSN